MKDIANEDWYPQNSLGQRQADIWDVPASSTAYGSLQGGQQTWLAGFQALGSYGKQSPGFRCSLVSSDVPVQARHMVCPRSIWSRIRTRIFHPNSSTTLLRIRTCRE
jgi:hypothetical protein